MQKERRIVAKMLFVLLAGTVLLAGCDNDETELGLDLQTSDSQFVGIHDTIEAPDLYASTYYDDSLRTSGYYTAMVGHYSDAVYGQVDARTFLQLALPSSSGINFEREQITIDSALLSLVINERYPVASGRMRIRIYQTAEKIEPDSIYYATDVVALQSAILIDTLLSIAETDTVLTFPLGRHLRDQISGHAFESTEALQEALKGLCVESVPSDSDPLMLTFDMTQNRSGLTLYYQAPSTSDEKEEDSPETVTLLAGYTSSQSASTHFTHFTHHYSGAFLQLQQHTIDSVDGSQRLYLEPLGGMAVRINIDSYVRRFHEAHPRAVIHYAELLLPVSSDADDLKPSRIVAYRRYATGNIIFINDYLSNYAGYDGQFDSSKGMYRIRVTQHLQGLMMTGSDAGTLLLLDGRRSSARRTILNGSNTTNPIRIAFTYSE